MISSDDIRIAILVVSLIVTFWTYKANKWATLRNAAALIALQAKNIENNVDLIKDQFVSHKESKDILNWSKIADMNNIFEEDYWEQYRHLFIFYLGESDFNQLDSFFSNSRKLKIYQEKVRAFIFLRADYQVKAQYEIGYKKILEDVANTGKCDWKYCEEFNKYYSGKDDHLSINTFKPNQFKSLFINSLDSSKSVIGTTGFGKIELIAKRNSWVKLWINFIFIK